MDTEEGKRMQRKAIVAHGHRQHKVTKELAHQQLNILLHVDFRKYLPPPIDEMKVDV